MLHTIRRTKIRGCRNLALWDLLHCSLSPQGSAYAPTMQGRAGRPGHLCCFTSGSKDGFGSPDKTTEFATDK